MTVPINQLVLYALFLILGWLLGLLSRPSGAKWRRQYEAERDARIALERTHVDRDNVARGHRADVERHAPATGAATAATAATASTAAAGASAAAAHGQRDDLSLIRGVGRTDEARLHGAGIHRYADLSRMSDSDAAALETRLGSAPGTIAREQWREQAAMLESGRYDEHRSRFG